MVDDVLYYVLVLLTLLPVYLLFKLIQWMGWELFVNNWVNALLRKIFSKYYLLPQARSDEIPVYLFLFSSYIECSLYVFTSFQMEF